MADGDPSDVFAFPDFEKPSKWLKLEPSLNQDSPFFSLDALTSHDSSLAKTADDVKPFSGHVNNEPSTVDQDGFFKLPPLFEPLATDDEQESDQGPSSPALTPLHDTNLPDLDVLDDGWFHDSEPEPPAAEFKTWDGFLMPERPEPIPRFITEAGPAVYEAAMSSEKDPLSLKNTDRNVIQTNPFVAALWGLALGRGSVFFFWDEKTVSFIPNLGKMRIPGYSFNVLQGVINACLQCGTISRLLSIHVRKAYRSHPSPVRVALAKAIDTVLLVAQTRLGEKTKQVRSLLQLQAIIQPVRAVLTYFHALVTKVSRLKTDEQVLSIVFNETRTLEHVDGLLASVMREVLTRISEPWTDFAEKWIGVKDEEGVPLTKEGPGKSFVKVEPVSYLDDFGVEVEELDYILDRNRVPKFIPDEVASNMFEAGKTLRLLRIHHPEHPLCRQSLITSSRPPALRWQFDWETIRNHQESVSSYEKSMAQKIQQRNPAMGSRLEVIGQSTTCNRYDMEYFGLGETELEAKLLASIQALDVPPNLSDEDDSLSQLLRSRLLEDGGGPQEDVVVFTPHWSVIPIHSFSPLIAAQARLINREYMNLIFGTHRLRDHLAIQKQFQLLGNGMFCSRLSHALFDPEMDTAERQAGVALQGGSMGLRLSGRETWPPASSELRLALMGVLTDTYLPPPSSSAATNGPNDAEKPALPGDISFAVRDLSPEEIERCMDPGSLEALDFLRLSYKTPAPLSPVITPVILMKYDRIFRLLLRVLRMLYVVGQTSRDVLSHSSKWEDEAGGENVPLRFNHEANHFVTSIASYFLETGVEAPWRLFESWLDVAEADLSSSADADTAGRVVGPDELRAEHERMLDRAMHTLLLRKRQQAVMRLLEDIFTSILRFSRLTRLARRGRSATGVSKTGQGGGGGGADPSFRELYGAFRKKVDVFITVCRGLSEKAGPVSQEQQQQQPAKGAGSGSAAREENTIDRLLMKLEMSGHYAQIKI